MVDLVGGKALVWIDGPASGAWNMAMDQAMALYAAEQGCIILRVYQWASPTLSLGYFQSHDDLLTIPGLEEIDCVRRETGGGAIVHDHEITYSVAVPRLFESSMQLKLRKEADHTYSSLNNVKKSRLGHSETLYNAVHDKTVHWLTGLGFDAKTFSSLINPEPRALATGAIAAPIIPTIDNNRHFEGFETGLQQAAKGSSMNPTSFLCFDRRSSVDIIVGSDNQNQKVLGSAQRRTSGALLQHGSLLLSPSVAAPHLSGLDVLGSTESTCCDAKNLSKINAKKWSWAIDFCRVLQDSVDEIWDCDWMFEEQTESVNQLARSICDEKFRTEEWTLRRSASQKSV
ncbi:MAG: hypothetical protein NTW52_09450 [Planctomycetota bacterium]|nr:hypothetical protein [Planctomycetota bacterium]